MNFNYSGSICSDFQLIKGFIDDVLNKLDCIIKNKDILFDLKLIMNELVINGVFHGNECIDTKQVNLSLEVKDNKIIITVKDEGRGVEYDINSYDPRDLTCGGRGLVLVNGLSDELYVDRNRIVSIIKIREEMDI